MLAQVFNQEEHTIATRRENHAFRRLMIIDIASQYRLFDFSFPMAWSGSSDGGITGFVLSSLQFSNEFGGVNGKMKFVLQPQHNPISDLLSNNITTAANSGTNSFRLNTTPTKSDGTPSESTRQLSPRRQHERTATFDSNALHRKSIKQQSVPTGLGNLGALTQPKTPKNHSLTQEDALSVDLHSVTSSLSSTSSLLYFVLSSDQVFAKSKLCCAMFLDGDDDWLDDSREFTKRVVNKFATMYKDTLEQFNKVSEEISEEEKEEEAQQLKHYEHFIETMHTMKLELLSERLKRKQHDSGNVVNESKHA